MSDSQRPHALQLTRPYVLNLILKLMLPNSKRAAGSAVKNPPALQKTQETRVPSLGWEDPLEEGMATHSSILAWRIPWTERAWQAIVHGVAKNQTPLHKIYFSLCPDQSSIQQCFTGLSSIQIFHLPSDQAWSLDLPSLL